MYVSQLEQEMRLEKESKRLELQKARAAKDEQKKVLPSEMFRKETSKYSQFDENVRFV